MEDFVTFELAKKLKEKGFNYNCLFAYNDEQIINPNVIEKYGVLSDDGYYELTKDGGGELDWDYVYIYETKLMLKRNIIVKRNFIEAPTISQVLKWLREEKKISIEVGIHYSLKWMCSIYEFSDGITDFTQYNNNGIDDTVYILYDSYELAALAGVEYCLDNLI